MEANFNDIMFFSFFTLTGNCNNEPKRLANRIFVFSIAFFCMVLIAAYTANLASFLVVQHNTGIKVNHIADAVRQQLRICAWRPFPPTIRLEKEYPNAILVLKNTELEVYTGLRENECDIALTQVDAFNNYKFDIKYNPDCNLEW